MSVKLKILFEKLWYLKEMERVMVIFDLEKLK